ncbi:MAG: PEP-CTERM sorting domain-containing protein [Pseudomonadales bacterium]
MRKRLLLILAGCWCLPALAAPIGIYWTDSGDGTLNRAGLDGTSTETLVSGLTNPNGGMFVSDSSIYWTDIDDQAVWRANDDGRDASKLVNTSGAPRDVWLADGSVFLVSTAPLDSISVANSDGSGASALITTGLSFPNGIAIYDNRVYWSDSGTRSISTSALDGSDVVEVIGGLPTTLLPGDVFVTNDYLYWTTRDLALTRAGSAVAGTVQRARRDGSEVATLVDGLVFPEQLVVAGGFLYWTDIFAGTIQRADLDGSGVTTLISGLSRPVGLAVVTSVPEPGSLALLCAGLAGLGFARQRRTRTQLGFRWHG